MKILLFEDEKYKDLFPLTMLRGTYDVKAGALSLKERIELFAGNKYQVQLHCRPGIAGLLREKSKNKVNSIDDDDYLLLNGRAVFNKSSFEQLLLLNEVKSPGGDIVYANGKAVTAAFISKKNIHKLRKKIQSKNNLPDEKFFSSFTCRKNNPDVELIDYPWDSIRYLLQNGISEDISLIFNANKKNFTNKNIEASLINPSKIFIAKDAVILPQAVIDASGGEVLIESGSVIEPFTYIKGPVHIGKNCLIKSGTKIYGPCTIGINSKIAGEVAESVFHSYVNKQHDGFTGHSYICPFVNLGADTVTSDLKNNYSRIKMNTGGRETDTGMQFLGSIIGDHSKTAINTMLNTGTVTGIFANIFGGGFPQKNIAPFSWNEAGKKPVKYDFNKAIETARIVMKRRGVNLSDEYKRTAKIYYSM